MGKKFLSLLLCLIMFISLFSGCSSRYKADKAFSAPILDEPTSLDPQIADSDSEKTIVLNCFEGLMRINNKGELENGVAESYSVSSDGLTYTFKLRSNAHWALFSGHKELLGEDYNKTFDINVYAEDFEFAFDRLFDAQINSPYKNMFFCVDTYKAVDKHTFTVKLKFADDSFLYALTCPGAMPCDREFYELTRGRYGLDAKYLLCNGAFNVSKWIEETSIRIVRNDDYNGENKVSPTAVTFFINSDESVVAEKMGTKTYDIAYLNKYNYESLENKDDYNAVSIENTVYSLIFNQNDKYLSNKDIRLAITYAVDLSKADALGENINRAVSIVPPFCKIGTSPYIDDSHKSVLLSHNEKKSKELLEKGLLDLGCSSVDIEIKCTEEYEKFIKQIVQTLQKSLGVRFRVSVNVVKQSELASIMQTGNYSVIFYPYTASSINIGEFFEEFSDSNVFNYESDEFKKVIKSIHEKADNHGELKKACQNAEKMLINDAVMIPVIYESSYFITSEKTQGIYFYSSGSNVYFINAVKK